MSESCIKKCEIDGRIIERGTLQCINFGWCACRWVLLAVDPVPAGIS